VALSQQWPGIIAAVGAWRTEITARWQAHAERFRTDAARAVTETSHNVVSYFAVADHGSK
jgi:hypothetical protein